MVLHAIAIDGPAGSGKTVITRRVASALGFRPIYTGMMYRALTWLFLSQKIPLHSPRMVEEAQHHHIDLRIEDGEPRIYVDGKDVTPFLRHPEVDQGVSQVASCAQVRRILVEMQRNMVKDGFAVLEGRDATTVIAPDACLKVFLTATRKERARRRWEAHPSPRPSFRDVMEDLARRDRADVQREEGPLRVHPDAIVIDTTDIPVEEVSNMIIQLWKERCR